MDDNTTVNSLSMAPEDSCMSNQLVRAWISYWPLSFGFASVAMAALVTILEVRACDRAFDSRPAIEPDNDDFDRTPCLQLRLDTDFSAC